jgi:hypothetical protein
MRRLERFTKMAELNDFQKREIKNFVERCINDVVKHREAYLNANPTDSKSAKAQKDIAAKDLRHREALGEMHRVLLAFRHGLYYGAGNLRFEDITAEISRAGYDFDTREYREPAYRSVWGLPQKERG